MKAIVLAGGLGTRIRSAIGEDLPKAMAPVHNKPFLEFILHHLSAGGVTEVVIAVGYKYTPIVQYFGDTFDGMQIKYSIESEPLGTGGALFLAMSNFASNGNMHEIIVLNGDTYFPVDLNVLALTHRENQADVTFALKHIENASRYALIGIDDDNRIVSFDEKERSSSGLINGGVLVLNYRTLQNMFPQGNFSLEQYFSSSISGVKMYGCVSDQYFIDIGIPEDYLKFQEYIADSIL